MTRFFARWTAAAGALAVAAACAHIEAPPGGPEDKQGPRLLVVRPDTMARLDSFSGPVVFVFDETLSEQGVEEAVEVSPRRGSVDVDHDGQELRVNLRRGWERGRIYQVTVAPGLRDRFNNLRTEPIRLVFSTGPAIPDTRLSGRVVERTTLQPLRGARVEAVLTPDSLAYLAVTDSVGGFAFAQIPEGDYLVRAYTDQNRSRELDSFEARDTARVRVAVAAPAETRLAVIAPDTTPPKLGTAGVANGVVSLRFDDFLDPAQPLRPEQVEIRAPDGTAVRVTELRVGPFPGAAEPGDSAAATPRPARGAPTLADTGQARADSAAGPVPSQALYARVEGALTPEAEYTVRATGIRNLLGLVGGGETKLRVPKPAPTPPAPATPRDSAGAAARPPAPGQAAPSSPAPTQPVPRPAPPPPAPPPGTLPRD